MESHPHAEGGQDHAVLRRVRSSVEVLRKRKWTVMIVTVLVVAATLAYTSQQTPIYRATATLIINQTPPQVLSGVKEVIELGSSNYWAVKDYLRTQYEIIRSREVAERVVDRLNLRGDTRFASAGDALPGTEQPLLDPVDQVLSKVQVEPRKDSLMVLVHVEDADREFATDLANAVAESYRDHNIETKKRIVIEAQKDLFKMVERLRVDRDKAQADLHAFEREHSIGSFDNQKRVVEARITDYTQKLNALVIRKAELEAKLRQLRPYKSRRDPFSVGYGAVLENPLVMSMKQRYVELEDKLSELRVTYLEKHPKVEAAEKQLRQLESGIRREIANIVQSAEDEYREVCQTEQSLMTQNEEAKTIERDLNRVKSAYEPLVARRDEANKFYSDVLYRREETTLSAESTMNNVQIHDLAVKPLAPVRPNWRLSAAVALFLGLLSGVGLAFLREFLDNTVKSREDVEEIADLSFLGVMPPMAADERGLKRYLANDKDDPHKDAPAVKNPALYIHYRTKSVVAERTRNIRTNLLFMMPEKPLKTVLVTSANPEEGKTTVSVNVAIAMAQGGSRTLLIDTDLRRPRVHKCFDAENDVGVSNAILEGKPIEIYIKASEVPNLDLLLCGPVPPDPTALLHTARFRDMMKALQDRYDVIILDSPPILPVTDAMIIANHADGVVMVAKSDRTTRDALALAKQELLQVNARILGCVLNDHDIARKGYGHYKYYRHRYYHATDGGDAKRVS